jgi:hypothetical protein
MPKSNAKSSSNASLSENLTLALLRDLANLRLDGFGRFRRRWSRFYEHLSENELLRRRDELRLLWIAPFSKIDFKNSKGSAASVPLEFTDRTEGLMEVVKHSRGDPLEKIVCDHWLHQAKHPWTVEWGKQKRFLAQPYSLPAVLALACVRHSDRFGICRNQKCAAPYFFLRRWDQQFCSQDCALPAQRAAKLRWWNKQGRRKGSKKLLKRVVGNRRQSDDL